MRNALALCALLLATGELRAQKSDRPNPTYDAVLRGMACRQQQNGQMDCEYNVGRSLRFTIAGVGQADAAVTFFKVNVDEDYYAGVTALHGCVVIRPSQASASLDSLSRYAFVSPRDGKAYKDWQSCHKATKRVGDR